MSIRVVIAEDEAIIRMDLRETLVEEGYEVVGETGRGDEAVQLVRDLTPDLALLDVKMPGMDGLEVAAVLTAEKLCGVLMLTAFSQREVVEQARDAGALAFLVKPFQRSDLVPAIEVAIGRFRELRDLTGEIDALGEQLESRKIVDRAKGEADECEGPRRGTSWSHICHILLFNLLDHVSPRSSNHTLAFLCIACSPVTRSTAISLWKSNSGSSSAVCFDCQADEFDESFGSHGPLSDAHKQVVEKWCSGIPGEGDDVEMVDGEEEEEEEEDGEEDDNDGEESEAKNGAPNFNEGGMEVEESEDSEQEENVWTCKLCTMKNADNLTKCSACDSRKPRR